MTGAFLFYNKEEIQAEKMREGQEEMNVTEILQKGRNCCKKRGLLV